MTGQVFCSALQHGSTARTARSARVSLASSATCARSRTPLSQAQGCPYQLRTHTNGSMHACWCGWLRRRWRRLRAHAGLRAVYVRAPCSIGIVRHLELACARRSAVQAVQHARRRTRCASSAVYQPELRFIMFCFAPEGARLVLGLLLQAERYHWNATTCTSWRPIYSMKGFGLSCN